MIEDEKSPPPVEILQVVVAESAPETPAAGEPPIPTPPILAIPATPPASPSHLRTVVLLIATLGGIYLCMRMIGPFVAPLAWALTLAVMFAPLQALLETRMKAGLAALIGVLAAGAVLVVPSFFVGQKLITHAANAAIGIDEKVQSGEWREVFEKTAKRVPLIDHFADDIKFSGAATTLTTWLSDQATQVVASSLYQMVAFCLILYVLFFLLRDRRQALDRLRSLAPLAPAEMDRLIGRCHDTIYATVYGTLATSAVQGLLGGLMFWWLGLPSPLLWGLVMALLSVVPVAGAFVVWVPAALYLAADGSWVKALILTIWGVAVVGTSDNLLRPVLVGHRLEQHTVLAFFAVIGGLVVFGASGLILGPLVLTLTTVFLEIWGGRIQNGDTPGAEALQDG